MPVRPVPAGFALRANLKRPDPGPEVLAHIQALWRQEKARRPSLFDGRFFSVARLNDDRAEGFLAPYSWRLAQRRDPALRQILKLRPLDVSCLSLCHGQVVFGRRSLALAIDSGLWELSPSGTVHGDFKLPDGGLDPLAHAAQETGEELGLDLKGERRSPSCEHPLAPVSSGPDERPARLVHAEHAAHNPQAKRLERSEFPASPGRVFALVESPDTGVLDLGVVLDLSVSPDELARLHRERGDGEYEELALVPLSEAPVFAESLGERLAPVSRALLLEFLRQASRP